MKKHAQNIKMSDIFKTDYWSIIRTFNSENLVKFLAILRHKQIKYYKVEEQYQPKIPQIFSQKLRKRGAFVIQWTELNCCTFKELLCQKKWRKDCHVLKEFIARSQLR